MEIYLIVFQEGMDVHRMDECPSENNLNQDDVVYIRVRDDPDELKLEHYSIVAKDWLEIKP